MDSPEDRGSMFLQNSGYPPTSSHIIIAYKTVIKYEMFDPLFFLSFLAIWCEAKKYPSWHETNCTSVHQYHLTEQALLMVGMPHHVLQSLRFCELYKSTGIINISFFP